MNFGFVMNPDDLYQNKKRQRQNDPALIHF